MMRVTNGSGGALQNVGVALTDGNGDMSLWAVGATSTDGTFDLSIPAGAALPPNALFQVTALDEDGDIAAFDGTIVNLAKGTQSIGVSSISYDNDDDGDEDSDGSEAVSTPMLRHSTHGIAGKRPMRRKVAVVSREPESGLVARPGGLRTCPALAPKKAVAGRPVW
jgi:hypothetical protein